MWSLFSSATFSRPPHDVSAVCAPGVRGRQTPESRPGRTFPFSESPPPVQEFVAEAGGCPPFTAYRGTDSARIVSRRSPKAQRPRRTGHATAPSVARGWHADQIRNRYVSGVCPSSERAERGTDDSADSLAVSSRGSGKTGPGQPHNGAEPQGPGPLGGARGRSAVGPEARSIA
jgi:hypothetical protein